MFSCNIVQHRNNAPRQVCVMEIRGMLGAQSGILRGGLGFKEPLCARPLGQLRGMNSGIYFLRFPLLPVCPVRLNPSMGLLRPRRTAASHARNKTDFTRASTQTSPCWSWPIDTLTLFTPGTNIYLGILNPGVNKVAYWMVAGDTFGTLVLPGKQRIWHSCNTKQLQKTKGVLQHAVTVHTNVVSNA